MSDVTPPIDVIRSPRRTKTIQASLVDGRIRLLIPARMSDADAERWAEQMTERIVRKRRSTSVDLELRARALARRYALPQPVSIEWSTRQIQRWGSCTPATGAVRVSSRLSSMPEWVLDSVIVHELAHLIERNHGPAFDAIVNRYPLTERARGYLIAKSE